MSLVGSVKYWQHQVAGELKTWSALWTVTSSVRENNICRVTCTRSQSGVGWGVKTGWQRCLDNSGEGSLCRGQKRWCGWWRGQGYLLLVVDVFFIIKTFWIHCTLTKIKIWDSTYYDWTLICDHLCRVPVWCIIGILKLTCLKLDSWSSHSNILCQQPFPFQC